MLLFWGRGKHIWASMLGECPHVPKNYWCWANQMAPSEGKIKMMVV
jgi:hypothetical protein